MTAGEGAASVAPDLLSDAARASIERERGDFARRLRTLAANLDDLTARLPTAAREARALADLLIPTKEEDDGPKRAD